MVATQLPIAHVGPSLAEAHSELASHSQAFVALDYQRNLRVTCVAGRCRSIDTDGGCVAAACSTYVELTGGRSIAYVAAKSASKRRQENSEMNNRKMITLVCLGVLGTVLPGAKADERNQKTVFTFSGPVEVPGQVLEAGTYVFKLMDSQSDRNIVQVFNKRENHLYGTFLTIPNYRLKPTGKTIITFEERAAGAPEAVKAWFYPGDNYGHEFVYPKAKAVELAKANNAPVPSMPAELAANTTKPATTMQ